MLFVKDVLFLNGAIASMAPDIDLLGEIMAIATYFTEHYGERIAREVGIEVTADTLDLEGYRAAMGFADSDPSETITFRDLQERRELIRKRLEHRADQQRTRTSTIHAVWRVLRRTEV